MWSIALPGFAQILNGHLVKGFLFIALEFLINVFSRFNLAIMHSFLGELNEAYAVLNFQWLMFYPCVYTFAAYDAYKHAEGKVPPYSFLPFVFCAYFVTVGLMYSPKLKLFGIYPGPVFLPMLFLIPGLFTGFLIRYLILRFSSGREAA
ncbi:hypothetical protein [Metabacillus lacus]|nr:hypothetical protein [Metabacillus lacus]